MKDCKETCYKYLSYSRTEYEVREYLKLEGFSFDDIEDAVVDAKALGYIDDPDYAQSFVNDHLLINRWGPIKIKMKLREKGIEESLIDFALEDNELIIRQNLFRAISKKAPSLDLSEYRDVQKLIRHLSNKGYGFDLIKEEIQNYEEYKSDE